MKTPAKVSVGGDGVDPSPIIQVKATQQGQYVGPILTIVGPMMVPCWASVVDGGPTWDHHIVAAGQTIAVSGTGDNVEEV